MIVITRTFRKYLSDFSHRTLDEIFSLLRKHARGLDTNLFEIEKYETYMILKWYLDGKRVRLLVARQGQAYIPLALYKKESKEGFNIRSGFSATSLIQKVEKDIQNDQFETFWLE